MKSIYPRSIRHVDDADRMQMKELSRDTNEGLNGLRALKRTGGKAIVAATLAAGSLMAVPSVADSQNTSMPTETLSGLSYIKNNVGNNSGNNGSESAPYLVWDGWQGPGYYLFPSKNLETGFAVASVAQLDVFNFILTGSNLGSPYNYTPPNTLQDYAARLQQEEPLIQQVLRNINATLPQGTSICAGTISSPTVNIDGIQGSLAYNLDTGETTTMGVVNFDETYRGNGVNVTYGASIGSIQNTQIYAVSGSSSGTFNVLGGRYCESSQFNIGGLNSGNLATADVTVGAYSNTVYTFHANLTYPQAAAGTLTGAAAVAYASGALDAAAEGLWNWVTDVGPNLIPAILSAESITVPSMINGLGNITVTYTSSSTASATNGIGTKADPYTPNSDGTITWKSPGWYDLTSKMANGGNSIGVYYVSNPAFITGYNQNISMQSPGTTTTTTIPVATITTTPTAQPPGGQYGVSPGGNTGTIPLQPLPSAIYTGTYTNGADITCAGSQTACSGGVGINISQVIPQNGANSSSYNNYTFTYNLMYRQPYTGVDEWYTSPSYTVPVLESGSSAAAGQINSTISTLIGQIQAYVQAETSSLCPTSSSCTNPSWQLTNLDNIKSVSSSVIGILQNTISYNNSIASASTTTPTTTPVTVTTTTTTPDTTHPEVSISGAVGVGDNVAINVSGLTPNGTWTLYASNGTQLTQPHQLDGTGSGTLPYDITSYSPLELAISSGLQVYAKDSSGVATPDIGI